MRCVIDDLLKTEKIDLSQYTEEWIRNASYDELVTASNELFTLAQEMEFEAEFMEADLEEYSANPSKQEELRKQITILRLNSALADNVRLSVDFELKAAPSLKIMRRHERFTK